MAQESVTNLIRTEAQKQGVNPELAVQIATVESGLNPTAQNPKSSASGLFQLIDKTRKQLGGDPKKKLDPLENVRLGVKLIKQNEGQLMSSLGRRPTDHELYMAHLFGPTGAVNLIQADPNTPVQKAVLQFSSPKTAESIVKNNRLTGTVGDVIGKFQQKFGGKPRTQQKTAPAKQKPAATEGPIPFQTGFDLVAQAPSYQAALAMTKLASLGGADEEEEEEKPVVEEVQPPSAAQMLAGLQMPSLQAFAKGGEVYEAPAVVVTPEEKPKTEAKSMLDKLLQARKEATSTIPGMAADIGASMVNPVYGTAASAADFETARREGDLLGMGLAGAGMVPVFGGMVRGGGKLLQRIGKEGAGSGGIFGSKEALKTSLGDFPAQVKQAWFDLTDEALYKDPAKMEKVLDEATRLDLFKEEQINNAKEAIDLFKKKMIDEETLDTVLTKNITGPLTNVWSKLEKQIGHIRVEIPEPPKK